MTGKLEHVRYDTFSTRWADRIIEDAHVRFALTPDGSNRAHDNAGDSPLADFGYEYQDLDVRPERLLG
jgi:hypothetical protein